MRLAQTSPWGGAEGGGLAGRSSWTNVELQLKSSGAHLEGPLATGNVCAGKGGSGGHHPHFADSKLKLRDICHYQPVSDQTSSPHVP